jgi:hypothetical protein
VATIGAMPTTVISLNALRDHQAIEQIITTLDPRSPLCGQLETMVSRGRDPLREAQLVGVAEAWVLRVQPVGGHPVYHRFDTTGNAHRIIAENAASTLAGGAL